MLARGKLSDLIQQYLKALDINPDWPEALCNLGIALTRLGGEQSLTTALTCFDRALAITPDFPSRATTAAPPAKNRDALPKL
jgi:tetratricopeptide (TPR) repeat protein